MRGSIRFGCQLLPGLQNVPPGFSFTILFFLPRATQLHSTQIGLPTSRNFYCCFCDLVPNFLQQPSSFLLLQFLSNSVVFGKRIHRNVPWQESIPQIWEEVKCTWTLERLLKRHRYKIKVSDGHIDPATRLHHRSSFTPRPVWVSQRLYSCLEGASPIGTCTILLSQKLSHVNNSISCLSHHDIFQHQISKKLL